MKIPFEKPKPIPTPTSGEEYKKQCIIHICWDWNEDDGDSNSFQEIDICKKTSPLENIYKPENNHHLWTNLTIKIRGNLNGYHIPDKDKKYYSEKEYAPHLIAVQSFGQVGLSDSAFKDCNNLKSVSKVDIPDASKMTTMDSMFRYCCSLESTLDNWDVSNVENMNHAFDMSKTEKVNGKDVIIHNCPQALSKLNPSHWDVSKVIKMGELFRYSSFNQNINNWDVSNVDYMYCMFANTQSYNQPLDKWNTSKVMDMSHMFLGNDKFNQNINNWDVSNVTRMGEMFCRAKSFDQDISNWNVSNVIDMINMFQEADSFDQDISGWEVNISDHNNMNGIFSGSGLVKNYKSKKSTNLCKIYNSKTWKAIKSELSKESYGLSDIETQCPKGE